MAKESMPFELKRPNAGTPVTNATEIDWENKPLSTNINEKNDEKSLVGNSNASSVEGKVNAMIDFLAILLDRVVFHSGTPFVTPDELKSQLNLLRYTYSDSSATTAVCGRAVCGRAICGTT